MAWTVDYNDVAEAQLSRLDPQTARRIAAFMRDRVTSLDNPRLIGHPLHGNRRGYWSCRVGDWRVICDIRDEVLIVLVVEIDYRSRVYR